MAVDQLERGRESYGRHAWADAFDALTEADQATSLSPDDLALLATTSYMLGRDAEYLANVERAYGAYVESGQTQQAARSAFWMGLAMMVRRQPALATGWFGRGHRLLESDEGDCVERGYMLLPKLIQQAGGGDVEGALATATEITEIAERFGDRDLFVLGLHEQGFALVRSGRAEEGLRLIDETMVSAISGELSPIVTGIVYCNVISCCQEVFELRRAQEWTGALTNWCEDQPDMVAHTGQCLIHRAEIMQLHGSWPDALEDARRAVERFTLRDDARSAARAAYRRGEVHRLQGDFEAAESAFKDASQGGCDPNPGLALMRLGQGSPDAAGAGIRRVLGETTEPLKRAALLPAFVEIMVALGEVDEADQAARELEDIAQAQGRAALVAMAEAARGAVDLARGDAGAALPTLRRAWAGWQDLEAPYETARVRVMMGLACRALGDDDSAALELEAARAGFEQLGAAPDVAHVDALLGRGSAADTHGLSARELEVLRLVAAGKSNREIASELVISEHTVARHVQNIFAKLGLTSRTAASAFAFEHGLV
jgi:DNA-binding CsgD family transcriptional regulator